MREAAGLWALIVVALCLPGVAWAADDTVANPPPSASAEGNAGGHHALEGPRAVELGHDLSLDLPLGFVFLEREEAKRFLEGMGNVEGDDLIGVAAPMEGSWIARLSYEDAGYVKDDDAKDLDAKELLESMAKGTEEANEERKARGFKPMHLDGWTDPPAYDRATHHLVWGIKGSSEDGVSVNHYTRILGRRGYVAVNVIDDPEHIAAAKLEAGVILAGTRFKVGGRYEDFDEKTDKVAEYGLAALIAAGAGAAALKGGLGGKLLLLLLAAKKAIIPLLLVAGAGLKTFIARLTGRKAEAPSAAAEAPTLGDPGAPPAT